MGERAYSLRAARAWFLYFFLIGAQSACSLFHDPVESIPNQTDKLGCDMPSTVVTLNRQGLDLEGVSLKDLAVGKANYQSSPELKVLLEKETQSSIVTDYLLCRAIARGEVDKNNPQQINYLRNFLSFMGRGPTPEEVLQWQRENKFPDGKHKPEASQHLAYNACVEQFHHGNALRDKISNEYGLRRREGTFAKLRDELANKWSTLIEAWSKGTESVLSEDPIARIQFRNAKSRSDVYYGENAKWFELDLKLLGKLDTLADICQRLAPMKR